MLVTVFPYRNLRDREFRHVRDVFETRNKFPNGDISRIEIRRVIRTPKQCGEVIGCRSVGEEDAV